jgi:hypothetical protein
VLSFSCAPHLLGALRGERMAVKHPGTATTSTSNRTMSVPARIARWLQYRCAGVAMACHAAPRAAVSGSRYAFSRCGDPSLPYFAGMFRLAVGSRPRLDVDHTAVGFSHRSRIMHRWVFFIAALLLAATGPAVAQNRVALVIGNAGYAHIAAQKTAINDAKLVAQTLRQMGFTDVTERFDLGMAAMDAAIEAFDKRADGAEWAVIYYAGHGLQVLGKSYLTPIDAKLANEAELEQETIKVDRLVGKPGPAQKIRLVILDMPRANPFPPRPWPSRPGNELLTDSLFIAYATQLGNVLSQAEGNNGAFAPALVRHIVNPGLGLDELFNRVRQDVMQATKGRQVVWTEASVSDVHQLVFTPR